MATLQTWEPYARSVLRIVAAFLYSMHGWQKLFGILGPKAHFGTLLYAGGWIETVAGGLILLGLFTRPAAFIACGEMAVAYFHVHAARGPWPLRNGGEPAVLNCFIFLYLLFAGAGPLSLDARLRRKQK